MALLAPRRRTAWLTPGTDLDWFEDRMRRMLAGWLPAVTMGETAVYVPPVELVDKNGEFTLTAEIPGMKPEDVDIRVEEDVLTIKGEKKAEHEAKEEHRYVWERTYGAFERAFTLPRAVDPAGIKAEFENGVLTIRLPKSAVAKGRHIEIEAEKVEKKK